MSSVLLKWDGLKELREALRQLPAHLASRAGSIVDRRAQNAAAAIRAGYARHRVTGNLANRVTVSLEDTGRFGAMAVVRARSPHAHLFEFGTQRRKFNKANRGVMPKANPPIFVPTVEHERTQMNRELIELVREAGFEVTGSV